MTDTTRVPARDASRLAVAALVSGVLAYVVFAIVTRALGPDGSAPVAVVWTWWSLAAAAITFPIQHWLTRTAAAHGGFGAVRSALPPLAVLTLAAALLTGAVAWLVRDPLFRDDGTAFPLILAALTAGSALMGVVRGGLGAREHFGSLAMNLLAENGARCAGVAVLWAFDVRTPAAYGVVIVAAHLTALLWPIGLRFPPTGRALDGGRRAALGLMTGASSGQLMAQVVLSVGPLVLAVQGGAPSDVTALFLGLAVYRAPYIVAMGVVPQLTGRFTHLVIADKQAELARTRQLLVGGTVVFAVGAVGVGLWVGPPLIRLVFGPSIDLPPGTSAILAVGSVFAVANLIASVLVIAHARTHISAVAWSIGIGCAALVLLTGLTALDRIAVGFLIAEMAALAVFLAATLRR